MKSVLICFIIAWIGLFCYVFFLGMKRLTTYKRLADMEAEHDA